MNRLLSSAAIVLVLAFQSAVGQTAAPSSAKTQTPYGRGRGQGKATPPPVQAKPEELSKIKEKTAQIEALVKELKTKEGAP